MIDFKVQLSLMMLLILVVIFTILIYSEYKDNNNEKINIKIKKMKKSYIVEFYQSKKPVNWVKGNRWRWRLKGKNGEVICSSSEGFYSKASAKRNLELTRDALNISTDDGTINEAYKNPL